MGYPQADSDKAVLGGSDFFRLNTLLASGGDIYERKQSGRSFAIGPESDIANVNIAYFDGQSRNFINQLGIAPARSFIGRVDANNVGKYAPIQRPARVLIWPDDRWNPLLLTTFTPHGSGVSIVETPRLDVIQYFRNQPSSIGPPRRDKTWFYQSLFTGGGTNTTTVVVPYYGRRYAKIVFKEISSVGPFLVAVTGIDFEQRNTTFGPLAPAVVDTPLVPPGYSGGAGVNGEFQFIVDSGRTLSNPATAPTATDNNRGGMFDLLEVTVRNEAGGNATHQEY